MPNDDEKGTFKPRKTSKPWKPPTWLERAFISAAVLVFVVAVIALLLWASVTFIVPFFIYTQETSIIDLDNGQAFQMEYPNLVLAEDTLSYITIILYGESNTGQPATLTVRIPPGLTVVEPAGQARSREVILTASQPGSVTTPTEMKIGVVNSRSVPGILLFVRRPIEISSTLLPSSHTVHIGMETTTWASTRRIVNNTINQKSALILLITGFLSGAGTLIFQYMKMQHDQVREDQQKKEKNFREDLDKDFLEAFSRFVNMPRELGDGESDFSIYERLVDGYGWEHRLQQLILGNLQERRKFDAKRAAGILGDLCNIFDHKNEADQVGRFRHSKSLAQFCDLVCLDDPKGYILTPEEAHCLLTMYKRWQELKPIVTNLIHDFAYLSANLPLIYEHLASEQQGQLLREANLQKIIDDHLQRLANNDQANPTVLTAAENIEKLLVLAIEWRNIWSNKERKLSAKVQRWLSGHWYEAGTFDDNMSIGSEFAELDNRLMSLVVDHPILRQIDGSFPVMVFGDEGMGKTASALWLLVDKCQSLAKVDNKETRAFPIYAPFEHEMDIKEWLVERVSHALIDFTADNPRRFLTAPESQKTAMSRLMLRYAQTADMLRINFYSSPFNSAANDIEQVLEYIARFKYQKLTTKLTNEEMLDLLYMAKPDGFDQVYFLWDIRSATPQEEVIRSVGAIRGLALPLAMQNFYFKVFAPISVAEKLKGTPGFRYPGMTLVWNEPLLRNLIETRIKMFNALWERGIDDPVGLVIARAGYSPRRVIWFLIQLMDYIDEHLQEGEKLNMSIFNQLPITHPEGSKDDQQNQQRSMSHYEHSVFVSYAWGGESERTVNDLEQAFAESGVSIIRDKKDLDYKDSVLEFERRIGRGQCIILVISDKYLHSEHCMYELVVMDENRNLHDRIFPIVLADARIYNPIDCLQYIRYWDEQIEKLNQAVKDLHVLTNLSGILANLEKYVRIRASFDHLSGLLSDMNALTPEMHAAHGYSTIISAVKQFITSNSILNNHE